MNTVKQQLFALQDRQYRTFQCNLLPTVDPGKVIGVRMPQLRKLAKTVEKEAFLASVPHTYFDENNLHAILINDIRDYGICLREVERFLPFVDNWATCDSLRPACFKNNTDALSDSIVRWLVSEHVYTVRFAIEMLMVHYLDAHFHETYPALVAAVSSEEYYVNMMIAWYFATALAKQWDCIIHYLTENRLPVWVHNKAIQKAVESFRISDDQKACLRKLKR